MLKVEPQPMGRDDVETNTMVDHTARVERAIAAAGGRPRTGIVMSLEKGFVLSNQASSVHGVNFGWYLPLSVGSNWKGVSVYPSVTLNARVVQQPSTFHGLDQDDYASGVVLVRKDVAVDGKMSTIDRVYQDPALAPLVSHEGVLRFLRQPGVDELAPSAVAVAKGSFAGWGMVLGAVIGGLFAYIPGAMVGGALGAIVDRLRSR